MGFNHKLPLTVGLIIIRIHKLLHLIGGLSRQLRIVNNCQGVECITDFTILYGVSEGGTVTQIVDDF
jgi:hypothetical protein